MKVKSLKMKSYRGIGDLEIYFDADEPIVLVGINGSGKTSILECISLLLASFINRINGKDDSVKNIFNKQDITVVREVAELRNEITLSHSIEGARLNENDIEDLTTFSGNLFISDPEFYSFNELENLTLISLRINNQLRTNSKFNLPIMVFYPIQRSFSTNYSDNNIPRKIGAKQQLEAYEDAMLGNGVNFSSFFNWFRNREDIENEQRLSGNLEDKDPQLEAVRNAIAELLPNFRELRIRRLPPRMTVIKQGRELNIGQLSDGEKCLLAMIGDLARRLAIANPGLSNPLHGTGIVLIDEIELHLHPQWQRGIIPSLTRVFPNCQFIVTTHSPQLISDIKPSGIYILEATESGISVRHPEISFGRDSNQILEELMGVSERPMSIKNDLRRLFHLIEAGDLTEAKHLQKHLENLIGDDEPEFTKADMLTRRKEILGR